MTNDPIAALYRGAESHTDVRWNVGQPLGTPVTVTYSFRNTLAASYGLHNGNPVAPSFQPFTEAAREATRQVLHAIEQVCGVRFTEVADGSNAMIEYGAFNLSDAPGTAYYPTVDPRGGFVERSGDVWLDLSLLGDLASGAAKILVHETMHTLGLKHPHDGGPDHVLDTALDSLLHTRMSYQQGAGYSVFKWQGGKVVHEQPGAGVPGPLDAIVLRHLYGPSLDTQSQGDGVYRYDDTPELRLLSDSGGIDTIDLSAITHAAALDLHDGHNSSVSTWTAADWVQTLIAQGMPEADARAYLNAHDGVAYDFFGDTFAIAAGTIIENVIGGPRGDRLTGNEADNVFTGGGGDDRIDGDAGFDTAVFAGNRRDYVISAGGVAVTGADGADSLQHVEALRFADRTVFVLDGADATLARLYGAAFARAPDAGGLAVQIHAAAGGLSALRIAGNFLGSAEFVARYGANTGSEAYVDALYQNVLGRGGDPGGRAVQLDALAHGLSRAQLLLNFADSAENRARVEGDWLFV